MPPRLWPRDDQGNWSTPPAERPARGMAAQFAKLQHPCDKNFKTRLASFVKRFGLLGITDLPEYPFEAPLYGKTYEENIDWWCHYAAEVSRLLQLYSAIKRARGCSEDIAVDILGEVLTFRQEDRVNKSVKEPASRKKEAGFEVAWVKPREKQEAMFVKAFWTQPEGETGFMFETGKEISIAACLIEAASYVLVGSISRGLAGGVDLEKGELKPSKRLPIGYSIMEQRSTRYPLAAIYFDLWELVRGDEVVEVCAYSKCSDLFTPQRSTGRFCSPACRVANGRETKKGSP